MLPNWSSLPPLHGAIIIPALVNDNCFLRCPAPFWNLRLGWNKLIHHTPTLEIHRNNLHISLNFPAAVSSCQIYWKYHYIYSMTPTQGSQKWESVLHTILLSQLALSYKNACCAANSTSQDIRVCCRCSFCIFWCVILPDLDVLKITLLKIITGVWWCAIALTWRGLHM